MRIDRIHPLLVTRDYVYASRGRVLFASVDRGESFAALAEYTADPIPRHLGWVGLGSRVGRLGFHGLIQMGDGTLVAIYRKAIVALSPGENTFRQTFPITRGSRPLRLAYGPTGRVYFGEYFSNRERDEVHIYASDDGRTWQGVYSFPAGRIRHVHGIFHDRFRNGMWVLTGDSDGESGLWFTDDDFRSLRCVIGGSQKARAVEIVIVPGGILVPMDSPREANFIQFLDLGDETLKPVAQVPGSVFHVWGDDSLALVSTVVEPSDVNKTDAVHVYGSIDMEQWVEVGRFRRDSLSRFSPRLFRYPELEFCSGPTDYGHVFVYGRGIKGLDGRMMRWQTDRLRSWIQQAPGTPLSSVKDATVLC